MTSSQNLHKFEIISKLKGDLEYASPSDDNRSDAAILASVSEFVPVTSETNVWAFWDRNTASMPGWCQRNVIGWVRLLGPSWTVRVLTSDPNSANYALKYIPSHMMPDSYVKNTMTGAHIGPHSADLVRGAILFLYGGVFLDVGILLVRHLDRICWDSIMDDLSPVRICVPFLKGESMVNFFVAARKGDPFIKRWHELFLYLWTDRESVAGLIDHPLMGFAKEVTNFDTIHDHGFTMEWNTDIRTMMEYSTQILCWLRLCRIENTGDGFSGADYWENHVLLLDVIEECWGAESVAGFGGQKISDLLALPLDSDPESEEHKEASSLVWRILSRSSLQKVYHARGMTKYPTLGCLWDQEENSSKDSTPGTFAELLRYGTLNFRQTREDLNVLPAPPMEPRLKKGLLEP